MRVGQGIYHRMRKGQEEVVGFVLIVVLVVVVFLLFLGLSLRKESAPSVSSQEIYQFLESSLAVSSSCAIQYGGARVSMSELLSLCKEKRRCLNGKLACEVAAMEIGELLGASWVITPGSRFSGYAFEGVSVNAGNDERFIKVEKGVCGVQYYEASYPLYPLEIRFRTCLREE